MTDESIVPESVGRHCRHANHLISPRRWFGHIRMRSRKDALVGRSFRYIHSHLSEDSRSEFREKRPLRVSRYRLFHTTPVFPRRPPPRPPPPPARGGLCWPWVKKNATGGTRGRWDGYIATLVVAYYFCRATIFLQAPTPMYLEGDANHL